MIKKYLLTPGPTPVPAEALSAEGQPILHHRTSEFSALFNEVKQELQNVFCTKNDVLIFAASGTGAMEGAVVNLLSPGDKALVLDTGVFGERWGKIAKVYGLTPIIQKEQWGNPVNVAAVKKLLDEQKDIKVIFGTLTETSTGVANDVKSLAALVNNRDTVLVIDAISGLGGQELLTDQWGVDVVIAGSQKGLMIPPGLAFASLSEKAWKRVSEAKLPKFYWDFKKYKDKMAENQTPFTPAVSLIAGLGAALQMLKKEGMQAIWERHKKMARATRAGVRALGLELFSNAPSDVVTAIKVPEGINGGQIVKQLREKYGVSIAGGQLELKGKIFRIAHLGYMERFDVIIGISAVEMILKELGHPVELGKGVGASMQELMK